MSDLSNAGIESRAEDAAGMKRPLESFDDVRAAIRRLDAWRELEIDRLIADFDHFFYMKQVMDVSEVCGNLGHSWRFSHAVADGAEWFLCSACGKSERRPASEIQP